MRWRMAIFLAWVVLWAAAAGGENSRTGAASSSGMDKTSTVAEGGATIEYWLQKAAEILGEKSDPQAAWALALTQAKAGMFSAAEATAKKISDAALKCDALRVLAEREIEAGKKEEADGHIYDAYKLVQDIEPDKAAAVAGARVSETQSKLKPEEAEMKFSVAFTIAEFMKDTAAQVETLCALAECEYRAGLKDDASEILEGLAGEVAKLAVETQKNEALRYIALAQSGLGLTDDARATAKRMAAGYSKDLTLRDIALALVARDRRDEAKAIVPEIATSSSRYSVLGSVAVSFARAGDFKSALDVANRLPDDEYAKSWAMLTIAQEQAKRHLVEEALSSAARIAYAPSKCLAYQKIAQEQIEQGRKEDALKSLEEALGASMLIVGEFIGRELLVKRAECTADVAALQVKAGDPQKALVTFEMVYWSAWELSDLGLRADALQRIAWAQVRAGNRQAIKTAVEALDVLKERAKGGTNSEPEQLGAVCDFARVVAKEGWPSGMQEAFEAFQDEAPVAKAWFCILAARGLFEKQHPTEKIDWEVARR